MAIARALYTRVMRMIHVFVGVVRRVLRCDDNNANGLKADYEDHPFEVVVDGGRGEERASLINNASMDSWDDQEWDKRGEIQEKIDHWRQSQRAPEVVPAEDDLFSSLEPTITHARKVVVKPRASQHVPVKRNLFEFNEASMGASAELGEIDDNLVAWEDDLDSTLQQHREEKHRQRQMEHERRLYEKKNQQAHSHVL